MVGGSAAQGTVTLSGGAPQGGAIVALSSSNPGVVSVPGSVTVAAGAQTATFAVATAAVSSATTVTISGSYNGVTRVAGITVNAPSQPPPTVALTVTATGRSGERVTSSPAGINVATGSTGSAVVHAGHEHHAERDQRPRRDLVGRVLERRRQAKNVHVHALVGGECNG